MNNFKEEKLHTIEKIVKQLIHEKVSVTKENNLENNNSFLFLEKSSLELLLTYLLSNTKNAAPPIVTEEIELNVLELLDQVMIDNEKEFQAIIHLLKEIT